MTFEVCPGRTGRIETDEEARNAFRVHGERGHPEAAHVWGPQHAPQRRVSQGQGREDRGPWRGKAGRAGPWVDPGCWAGVHSGVRAPGSARTGLPGMAPPQAADGTDSQSGWPLTAASDATKGDSVRKVRQRRPPARVGDTLRHAVPHGRSWPTQNSAGHRAPLGKCDPAPPRPARPVSSFPTRRKVP